jgi:hypothetical protein
LRGGDPLWSEIQKAIEEASAFAVVISPDALQSKWVGRELVHALEVRKTFLLTDFSNIEKASFHQPKRKYLCYGRDTPPKMKRADLCCYTKPTLGPSTFTRKGDDHDYPC